MELLTIQSPPNAGYLILHSSKRARATEQKLSAIHISVSIQIFRAVLEVSTKWQNERITLVN
jgi:hypothetical protein